VAGPEAKAQPDAGEAGRASHGVWPPRSIKGSMRASQRLVAAPPFFFLSFSFFYFLLFLFLINK
jgi:hypothetical protein